MATELGIRAIEEVKVGDRVLAQNPQTGEVAFKPVEATTTRNAGQLVKIGTGASSVTATRGHPFWIEGRGWRTAKTVEVGDFLHGHIGSTMVDCIEPLPPDTVYNLVVGDWHDYFVGDARLLVHDNSPIEETIAPVPGLVSR